MAASLVTRVYQRIKFIIKNLKKYWFIIWLSYASGCVVTFFAVTTMLLYANDRNPKDIREILGGIFVQVALLRLRYIHNKEIVKSKSMSATDSFFRVTPTLFNSTINNASKYKDNNQYPFIRILPHTKPSNRYIVYDSLIHGQKNTVKRRMKAPYSSKRVTGFRKVCDDGAATIFKSLYPSYTKITIEKLTDNQIPCHWIKYEGSSIDNGVIIGIHGGGYIAGSPGMQYGLCSLLSKLTGCVCLTIDYRLAPEHPLPAGRDDCVAVYKYLISELKILPSSLCIMGESAGGGLSLLTLQYLNDNNIELPSCCWINSPWVNLECKYDSWKRNSDHDAILTFDPTKSVSQLIVGNMDIDGIRTGKTNDCKQSQYSPISGKFKGLCPLYFHVGGTEMLIEDTIEAASKAYKSGVDVKVDILPNIFHTGCLFQRGFVESHYITVRAADFMLNHINK